jgi:hypothetical protein
MFRRFFKAKNQLPNELIDIAQMASQEASASVREEVQSFIKQWAINGLADITLKETEGITYLLGPMNRGIHFDARKINLSAAAWKEMMFFFVRVLLLQDYVPGHGEVKTDIKESHIKTKFYSYLKPSIKYRARNPVLQIYGNIYIHLEILNDQTQELKITSNIYQGRGYVEPHPFEELIALFFEYR